MRKSPLLFKVCEFRDALLKNVSSHEVYEARQAKIFINRIAWVVLHLLSARHLIIEGNLKQKVEKTLELTLKISGSRINSRNMAETNTLKEKKIVHANQMHEGEKFRTYKSRKSSQSNKK